MVPLPDPNHDQYWSAYRAESNLATAILNVQAKVDENQLRKNENAGLSELLVRMKAFKIEAETLELTAVELPPAV